MEIYIFLNTIFPRYLKFNALEIPKMEHRMTDILQAYD